MAYSINQIDWWRLEKTLNKRVNAVYDWLLFLFTSLLNEQLLQFADLHNSNQPKEKKNKSCLPSNHIYYIGQGGSLVPHP